MSKSSGCKRKTIELTSKLPLVFGIDSLSRGAREVLSWFVFKYEGLQHSQKHEPMTFASVFAKELFGRHYAKYTSELENAKIIYAVFHDTKYGRVKSSRSLKLCARYRLGTESEQAIELGQWAKERVEYHYRLKPKRRAIATIEKGIPKRHREVLTRICENYSNLGVDPKWIGFFENDPEATLGQFIHCLWCINEILSKRISASVGKEGGRVFHPVVQMNREVREFVRHGRELIYEIDANCFHTYLLAHYLDGRIQKRYLEFLGETDIYGRFCNENVTRDMVKRAFQKFLAGSMRDRNPHLAKTARAIDKFYREEFTEIVEARQDLKLARKTFQAELQCLESEIFKRVFLQADFWCLPMHDGIAILRHDIPKALALVDTCIQEKLGYRIKLEVKEKSRAIDFPMAA